MKTKQMIISAVLLLVMALSPLTSARAASPAALSPLTSQTFDEVGYFYNGYACVVKGDDAGYLDKAGVFHKTYKLSDVMANRREGMASHLGYLDHTALTMSKEGLYPYFDSATNGWGVKNINTGAIILPAENLLPTIYRCGRGIVVNLYYASERDGGTQLLSNDWNANAGGGGYSELASSEYKVYDTRGKLVFSGTGRTSDYYVGNVMAAAIEGADREGSYGSIICKGGLFDLNGKLIKEYDYEPLGADGTVFAGNEVLYFMDPLLTWDDYYVTLVENSGIIVLPTVDANNIASINYCKLDGTLLHTKNTGKNLYEAEWYSYSEEVCIIQDEDTGLCGAIDINGKVIIPEEYMSLGYCTKGHFWAVEDETWNIGVKGKTGKTVIPFEYDDCSAPGERGIGLSKDGKWGFVSYDNKALIPFEYDFISGDFDGILVYAIGDKYGYMTLEGKKLTEAIYEDVSLTREGTVIVEAEGGTYSYLKLDGAAQPETPSSGTAYAGTSSVNVDGKEITFNLYALKDSNGDLTNYIKLRDIAFVLNGSKAQFNVGWNNSINLESRTPYTTQNGSEMIASFSGNQPYASCTSKIYIDGELAKLEAITLTDDAGGGHNYFKLRDVGRALGFNVSWDSVLNKIVINSNELYSDEA